MRVESLITSAGKERYMVVDDKGEPVAKVAQELGVKPSTMQG